MLWLSLQAKLNAPFGQYLGQLAAEMLSAREEFAMTTMKKRKAEAASALPQVCIVAVAAAEIASAALFIC